MVELRARDTFCSVPCGSGREAESGANPLCEDNVGGAKGLPSVHNIIVSSRSLIIFFFLFDSQVIPSL